MFNIFTLVFAVVIFNFVWNTDEPFGWKLSVSGDSLSFRPKYPADYRLENPQEMIDALALQLARSGRADRYLTRR
jgi:hypothetical protein